MNAPVFVDTNVLLYARDARHARKQARAKSWIERLWKERLARTSMQVLSEYYVNATRKLEPGLSADDAWDDVEAFLTWDPLPLDREVIASARDVERRYRLNWWDCLVVAAASLQGCRVLLTEDLQDGAVMAAVTVRNPFTSTIGEAAATYTAPRVLAPRHPPRGRPRKRIPA